MVTLKAGMRVLISAAPHGERRMIAQRLDHARHLLVRDDRVGHREGGRPPAGGKLLIDHDALFIAETVELIGLDDAAAPGAEHLDAAPAGKLEQMFIFGGIAFQHGIAPAPVGALDEHRHVVDHKLPAVIALGFRAAQRAFFDRADPEDDVATPFAPLRKKHEVNTSPGTHSVEQIYDEYSLRIGAYIRRLIDAVGRNVRDPQVALVYHSFSAAALPGGPPGEHLMTKPVAGGDEILVKHPKVLPFYENTGAKQIEGLMHQLGVDFKVIPYELLECSDLTAYKLVIVPDPMHLNDATRRNLQNARSVMYAGEYLMAHRDPATGKSNYLEPEGFSAQTESDNMRLRYFKAPAGKLTAHGQQPHKWLENISLPEETPYPSDQMVVFDSPDQKFDVVLRAGELPIIVVNPDGNEIFVTNRFFHQGWNMESDWLEKIQYGILRNLFNDLNLEVRLSGESKSRVKSAPWYGSCGLSGHIA